MFGRIDDFQLTWPGGVPLAVKKLYTETQVYAYSSYP